MTDDAERHAVWIAMSELFLDTEHSPASLRSIFDVLMAAPFDLVTLEGIFVDEVCPVCFSNLRSVAGVWDGFDPDQLIAECQKTKERRPSFARLGRFLRRQAIRTHIPEWQHLRQRLQAHGKT